MLRKDEQKEEVILFHNPGTQTAILPNHTLSSGQLALLQDQNIRIPRYTQQDVLTVFPCNAFLALKDKTRSKAALMYLGEELSKGIRTPYNDSNIHLRSGAACNGVLVKIEENKLEAYNFDIGDGYAFYIKRVITADKKKKWTFKQLNREHRLASNLAADETYVDDHEYQRVAAVRLVTDAGAFSPDDISAIKETRLPVAYGSMGLSRAIGDLEAEDYGLSSQPEIGYFSDDLSDADAFILVSTDGLFEQHDLFKQANGSNVQPDDVLLKFFTQCSEDDLNKPELLAEKLGFLARAKYGSHDDCSFGILKLKPGLKNTSSCDALFVNDGHGGHGDKVALGIAGKLPRSLASSVQKASKLTAEQVIDKLIDYYIQNHNLGHLLTSNCLTRENVDRFTYRHKEKGYPLLYLGIAHQSIDFVAYLLQLGIDPKIEYALHYATHAGCDDLIKYFIETIKMDPNSLFEGNTALAVAEGQRTSLGSNSMLENRISYLKSKMPLSTKDATVPSPEANKENKVEEKVAQADSQKDQKSDLHKLSVFRPAVTSTMALQAPQPVRSTIAKHAKKASPSAPPNSPEPLNPGRR